MGPARRYTGGCDKSRAQKPGKVGSRTRPLSKLISHPFHRCDVIIKCFVGSPESGCRVGVLRTTICFVSSSMTSCAELLRPVASVRTYSDLKALSLYMCAYLKGAMS